MFFAAGNQPTITAPDPGTDDAFAYASSWARKGTMAVISAEAWEGAIQDQGAVYSYHWRGSFWLEGTVTAPDAVAGDFFGRSCALSEDGMVLAVGAHQRNEGYSRQGAVYIFDRNSTDNGWTYRYKVVANNPDADDMFGQSCDLSGDGSVLVVGAIGKNNDDGRVYVVDLAQSSYTHRYNFWDAETNATGGEAFGRAVSLNADGDLLAVGVDLWTGSLQAQGKVALYDLGSTTETFQQSFVPPDAALDDRFGCSIDLRRDGLQLAVGAEKKELGIQDQGVVYVLNKTGSVWEFDPIRLVARDASAGDRFGKSVSWADASGSGLLVGAHQWEGGNTNQGAAYLFSA